MNLNIILGGFVVFAKVLIILNIISVELVEVKGMIKLYKLLGMVFVLFISLLFSYIFKYMLKYDWGVAYFTLIMFSPPLLYIVILELNDYIRKKC